jgi:hypothetical protein
MYDENGDLLHQIRMQGLQRVVEPEQFLNPCLPLAGIDWYDEAQEDKAKQVDEMEKGMLKDTKNSADYGSITLGKD